MGNVNYVTARRRLKASQVRKDVEAILLKRFGDKAKLDRITVSGGKRSNTHWHVSYEKAKPFECIFEFWMEGPGRVTFDPAPGYFATWVEGVVRHELAKQYNGWLSCEDDSIGKWKPNPKPQTMREWLERIHERAKDIPSIKEMIEIEVKEAPLTEVLG